MPVLKSHETKFMVTSTSTPILRFCCYGNGGMGDTFSWDDHRILAQFPQNDQTIAAAIYLHSFIGDQLAKEQYIVLPTQISEALPKWMNYFCKNQWKTRHESWRNFRLCARTFLL